MDFLNFITESNLIIVAVLYAIGMFLKSSKAFKDNLIPLTLMVLGIVFSVVQNGPEIMSFYQGILASATAVFTNQLIKQFDKGEY